MVQMSMDLTFHSQFCKKLYDRAAWTVCSALGYIQQGKDYAVLILCAICLE